MRVSAEKAEKYARYFGSGMESEGYKCTFRETAGAIEVSCTKGNTTATFLALPIGEKERGIYYSQATDRSKLSCDVEEIRKLERGCGIICKDTTIWHGVV